MNTTNKAAVDAALAFLNFWGDLEPTENNSVLVIECGGEYTGRRDGKPHFCVGMYLQKRVCGRIVCSPIRHNDIFDIVTVDDLVEKMGKEVTVFGFPPVHGIWFRESGSINTYDMRDRFTAHREEIAAAKAVAGL